MLMRLLGRTAEMSEERLIRSAEIIARTWEGGYEEKVAALRLEGFTEAEAWRLIELLPMAFGRPILEKLGITNIGSKMSIMKPDGSSVTARLMRQPEYVGGVKLARAHLQYGRLDHQVYELIAGGCSSFDAVSKALEAGADLRGATIAYALHGEEIARYIVR